MPTQLILGYGDMCYILKVTRVKIAYITGIIQF